MFMFEGLCSGRFLSEIGLNRLLIGVVVCQSRIDLRHGQVSNPIGNVFWGVAESIPLRDAPNRNPGACDAGASFPNVGIGLNKAPYMNVRCHLEKSGWVSGLRCLLLRRDHSVGPMLCCSSTLHVGRDT